MNLPLSPSSENQDLLRILVYPSFLLTRNSCWAKQKGPRFSSPVDCRFKKKVPDPFQLISSWRNLSQNLLGTYFEIQITLAVAHYGILLVQIPSNSFSFFRHDLQATPLPGNSFSIHSANLWPSSCTQVSRPSAKISTGILLPPASTYSSFQRFEAATTQKTALCNPENRSQSHLIWLSLEIQPWTFLRPLQLSPRNVLRIPGNSLRSSSETSCTDTLKHTTGIP